MTDTTTPAAEARGLAVGGRLVLRAPVAADLGALAQLLAANPGQRAPRLWTEQYLKQQFEREKDPGLWCEREKYYVAVEHGSAVPVGYVRQIVDGPAGDMFIVFHVADGAAGRDALGQEMLQLYVDHAARWTPRHRIGAEILAVEPDKAGWLAAAGFVHELDHPRYFLYLGEPVALSLYAWFREDNQ